MLRRADDRAGRLIQAGASVRGVSRQLVLDLFGAEVADEVYPQKSGQDGSALEKFVERVEADLLDQVKRRGYTTTGLIRDALASEIASQSLQHRRIERVLPGLLARHGLTKQTVNEEMKRHLGIKGPGYPKVIIPAEAQMPAAAGERGVRPG